MSAGRSRALRLLGTLARVALVALAIYLVSRAVHWQDQVQVTPAGTKVVPGIKSTLANARWGLLALAFGCYFGGVCFVGLRWSLILRLLGQPVSFLRGLRLLLQSMTVGLVLPGSVGGDLYRVTILVTGGVNAIAATASVLLDRLLGLWVLVLGAGAVAFAIAGPGQHGLNALLLAAGLATPPGVLLAARLFALLPERLRAKVPGSLIDAFRSLGEAWRGPKARFLALGASSLMNTAGQLGCFLALVTCYWHLPEQLGMTLVGLALGMIANAIPVVPQGIGVGEAAFVGLLGLAGVPAGPVLATMLTFRLLVYLVAVGASPLVLLSRGAGALKPANGAPAKQP